MKHYDTATEIKIWTADEINHPELRLEDYKKSRIHAIEAGSSKGEYIVEVTSPEYWRH